MMQKKIMTKKILIINGHQKWDSSPGQLNKTLVDEANLVLKARNYELRNTLIDEGWNNDDEVENFVWADVILFQFPVFWFGVPWGLKKYIDEVYMAGHGKIFQSDGRSSTDSSKKYGSGGLLQGRKHMLSITWNAPEISFKEPDQLFEQKSVDDNFFWLHKANKFVGLTALPTFSCHDVMKQPDVQNNIKRWRNHLNSHL